VDEVRPISSLCVRLRKQGHCAYKCEYHLVFTSKYRRKIFNSGSYAYLQELISSFNEMLPEVEILEINHDVDHVHILISIPPKMRVSDVYPLPPNLCNDFTIGS
jgi:putative transposase